MVSVDPPMLGLSRYGREWVPGIHFTRCRDRTEFVRLADWLCREFGAEVVERYGSEGEDGKEYWTLRVDGSGWLLMRCFYPRGSPSRESVRPTSLRSRPSPGRSRHDRPAGVTGGSGLAGG